MNIKSVSFGKKVPIMTAKVKNVKNNSNIPVRISEYDCKDIKDVYEMRDIGYDWYFNMELACAMLDKHSALCNPETVKTSDDATDFHFYVMEDAKGKPMAICETIEDNDNISVEYIESTKNKDKKYCGQTMLAALGSQALKKRDKTLYVSSPVDDSISFYKDKCGFKLSKRYYYKLELANNNLKNFIERVQKNTGSHLLDNKV